MTNFNIFVFNVGPLNPLMMKVKVAVFFLVLFGLSACSQYTCPTYAKEDVKKKESTEQTQRI